MDRRVDRQGDSYIHPPQKLCLRVIQTNSCHNVSLISVQKRIRTGFDFISVYIGFDFLQVFIVHASSAI